MFVGSHSDWIKAEIAKHSYWFHKMELAPGLVTPGWSDPRVDKLPHFGLPERLDGLRVLDVGCADGFFSFEAERRGASEVIAIDSSPDSVRRFNISRAALGSQATAFLANVYDVNRRQFGTFDVVLFYGVLYHLRHPLLALEKLEAVCTGTLLLQTANFEDSALGDASFAKFHPFGIESGPPEKRVHDPTVFWLPNAACVRDMLRHVGFHGVEQLSMAAGVIFRAQVLAPSAGAAPDQRLAPWS
jgi:tRNA (mo5U34)-methyltransferase